VSETVATAGKPVGKASTAAPMIVSLIVLAFFAALIGIATWNHDENTLNGYGEVVKNLVIMVVSFWIGSSVGSARKDAVIAASQPVQGAQ
jgi:hypothetical protein